MTILEFQRKTPHVTGPCKCIACKHEWVGVVEVEQHADNDGWLECPKCFEQKGRLIFPYRPPVGTYVFLCLCDNELFNVTKDGVFCPNCGTRHTF